MLFNRASVLSVLPDQERQIREEIQSLKTDYVLNVSEEDLIASLVGKYTLYVPILQEQAISVDYGEQKIDISHDRMRIFDDRPGPFYVAGTRVTFIVPFEGDPSLFDVQPQTFSYSLSGSRAEIVGTEIHITYAGADLNSERAKRDFVSELNQIKLNLGNLKTAIDRHNAGLADLVRGEIQKRKRKLLADANLAAAIVFPLDGVTAYPQLMRYRFRSVSPRLKPRSCLQENSSPNPLLRWRNMTTFSASFATWFK